jgi:hypothetical protein
MTNNNRTFIVGWDHRATSHYREFLGRREMAQLAPNLGGQRP